MGMLRIDAMAEQFALVLDAAANTIKEAVGQMGARRVMSPRAWVPPEIPEIPAWGVFDAWGNADAYARVAGGQMDECRPWGIQASMGL
jgi:hypothetical protein